MSKTEARNAARKFISDVTRPDRAWTVATIEAALPAGWRLNADAEVGDFFPLTVANVANSILANCERAVDSINAR